MGTGLDPSPSPPNVTVGASTNLNPVMIAPSLLTLCATLIFEAIYILHVIKEEVT